MIFSPSSEFECFIIQKGGFLEVFESYIRHPDSFLQIRFSSESKVSSISGSKSNETKFYKGSF
jgi:hypothetical protein